MRLPRLQDFQNRIGFNKIFERWQEVNNDLFGSIMLHEVLKTFQNEINSGIDVGNGMRVNIKITRLNVAGSDSLVGQDRDFPYYSFQNMCNCTGTTFMHDEWGFSNSQRPDGMWRLDIMDKETERILHTIPIFLETDSGNDSKARQARVTAMKLWQDISCGHLIPETCFVCIMRLNVEQGSKSAFNAAANSDDYVKAHLAQLAFGCALVIYTVIQHFIPKSKRMEQSKNYILSKFAPAIDDADKKSISDIFIPYDLHFLIGMFEFDAFNFSHHHNIKPEPDKYAVNAQQVFNRCERKIDLSQYFPDWPAGQRKFYLRTPPNYPNFVYSHDKTASDVNRKEPRNTDNFFQNFPNWSTEMTYAVQNTCGFNKFTQARCMVHCIATKRHDNKDFEKLQELIRQHKNAAAVVGIPQLLEFAELLGGMWYMKSIIKLLDVFIQESNGDTEICDICKKYFNIAPNVTKIKKPETNTYTELCKRGRKSNEKQIQYFVGNTGFAMFIDPMSHVMENVFYVITKGINWKPTTSKNLKSEMEDFKKSFRAGTLQSVKRTDDIKIPRKSLNLTTMCLMNKVESSKATSPELAHDLKRWLTTNSFNNEYCLFFCRAYDCRDKYRLHLLATEYHENDDMQANIQYRIKHLNFGVQLDIKDMLKQIYRDSMFLIDNHAAENDSTFSTIGWDAHYWTDKHLKIMFRENLLYKIIQRNTSDDINRADTGIEFYKEEGKIIFTNNNDLTKAKVVLEDDAAFDQEKGRADEILVILQDLDNEINLFKFVFNYIYEHKLLHHEAYVIDDYWNHLEEQTEKYKYLWRDVETHLHQKIKKFGYNLISVHDNNNYLHIYADVLYQIAFEFDEIIENEDVTQPISEDVLEPVLVEWLIKSKLVTYSLLVHNQAMLVYHYSDANYSDANNANNQNRRQIEKMLRQNASQLNKIKSTLSQLHRHNAQLFNNVVEELFKLFSSIQNSEGIDAFLTEQENNFYNQEENTRMQNLQLSYFWDKEFQDTSNNISDDISGIFTREEWQMCCEEEHIQSVAVNMKLTQNRQLRHYRLQSNFRKFFVWAFWTHENLHIDHAGITNHLYFFFKNIGTMAIGTRLGPFMQAYLRYYVKRMNFLQELYPQIPFKPYNFPASENSEYKGYLEGSEANNVKQSNFLTPAMFGVYLQNPVEYIADVYFQEYIVLWHKDVVHNQGEEDQILWRVESYNQETQQRWQEERKAQAYYQKRLEKLNTLRQDLHEKIERRQGERMNVANNQYDISYFYISQNQSSLLFQVMYRYFGIMMATEFDQRTCQRVYLQRRFPKLKKNYIPLQIYKTKKKEQKLYKNMQFDLQEYLLQQYSVLCSMERDVPWLLDKDWRTKQSYPQEKLWEGSMLKPIDDYFGNEYKLGNSIHICWTWKYLSLKLTWHWAFKFKTDVAEEDADDDDREE